MSGAPPREEVRYFFIRRPVMAAVISILITLLGVFAIRLLPVSRYPQISPPAVQVSAVYPGATAQDVADAVAAPIEEQLSGLQGLLYYSSSNASTDVVTRGPPPLPAASATPTATRQPRCSCDCSPTGPCST